MFKVCPVFRGYDSQKSFRGDGMFFLRGKRLRTGNRDNYTEGFEGFPVILKHSNDQWHFRKPKCSCVRSICNFRGHLLSKDRSQIISGVSGTIPNFKKTHKITNECKLCQTMSENRRFCFGRSHLSNVHLSEVLEISNLGMRTSGNVERCALGNDRDLPQSI